MMLPVQQFEDVGAAAGWIAACGAAGASKSSAAGSARFARVRGKMLLSVQVGELLAENAGVWGGLAQCADAQVSKRKWPMANPAQRLPPHAAWEAGRLLPSSTSAALCLVRDHICSALHASRVPHELLMYDEHTDVMSSAASPGRIPLAPRSRHCLLDMRCGQRSPLRRFVL